METPTADALVAVLAGHRDVAARLDAVHAAAWAAGAPGVLELCRLRIAQLLGNEAELRERTEGVQLSEEVVAALRTWPTSPRFGPRERACLAFCEQSLIDVANGTADETAAVADVLGVQGRADVVSALLVVEQRQRLCLSWAKLIAGGRDGP